jgi:orsellinic acid C2-O-methyltransferase
VSDAGYSTDRETLQNLLTGHLAPHVIYTATQLGLPGLLASGTNTTEELAAATETHPPSLGRLLRALASVGIVTEPSAGRYELTPMGTLLLPEAENSLNATVLLNFNEEAWRSWATLAHSIKTGEPSFEHIYQTQAFPYFASQPGLMEIFNRAMAERTRQAAIAVVANYDFSRFSTVVDVGGNDGTLISGILNANPGIKGVLFDTADGIAQAVDVLGAAGVDDRCQIVPGDFFVSVPEGGDVYTLKSVIHDWDDEKSIAILKSCRKAIPDDALLLLVEPVMPDVADETLTIPTVVSDINMLVYTGGVERTVSEFGALLAAAGFELTRVIGPLNSNDYRIVEAKPV